MIALVFNAASVRRSIVNITVLVISPVASWLPFLPKMMCVIAHLQEDILKELTVSRMRY